MRAAAPLAALVLALVGACDDAAPVPNALVPTVTVPPLPSAPTPTPTRSATASATPTAVVSRAANPSPTSSPAASYRWSARRVTAADLPHSWRPGCPVAPAQLRLLTLPYRDFSGARRTGEIVVNAQVVDDVVAVFRALYRAGFPVRSLRLVDEYDGDDDRSMAADNTSAFNCRNTVGGSGWSQHAYGLAIDVNPVENPYVYGDQVLPPAGSRYTDRSVHRRGMAYPGSVVSRAFAAQGWGWGGRWSHPDYQHFSRNGQ